MILSSSHMSRHMPLIIAWSKVDVLVMFLAIALRCLSYVIYIILALKVVVMVYLTCSHVMSLFASSTNMRRRHRVIFMNAHMRFNVLLMPSELFRSLVTNFVMVFVLVMLALGLSLCLKVMHFLVICQIRHYVFNLTFIWP